MADDPQGRVPHFVVQTPAHQENVQATLRATAAQEPFCGSKVSAKVPRSLLEPWLASATIGNICVKEILCW